MRRRGSPRGLDESTARETVGRGILGRIFSLAHGACCGDLLFVFETEARAADNNEICQHVCAWLYVCACVCACVRTCLCGEEEEEEEEGLICD